MLNLNGTTVVLLIQDGEAAVRMAGEWLVTETPLYQGLQSHVSRVLDGNIEEPLGRLLCPPAARYQSRDFGRSHVVSRRFVRGLVGRTE